MAKEKKTTKQKGLEVAEIMLQSIKVYMEQENVNKVNKKILTFFHIGFTAASLFEIENQDEAEKIMQSAIKEINNI